MNNRNFLSKRGTPKRDNKNGNAVSGANEKDH